jgi:hypothetical protein
VGPPTLDDLIALATALTGVRRRRTKSSVRVSSLRIADEHERGVF